MKKPDKSRKDIIALATSLGFHLVLLFLFLFLVSWKAPNPPLSALGGIELNFGLDVVGSGDVQPHEPVGSNQQDIQPTQEKIEDVPTPENPTIEAKPAETLTTTDESPVELPEKKTKKELPKKNEIKESEVAKSVTESKPVVDKSKPVESVSKKGAVGNQGDDKGKLGDKGSPTGSLDANALYGKQGTGGQGGSGIGGGFALQMVGWAWDEQPKAPQLPDNENGRVVFEIEVDEEGEITSIKTIERSLSPEAEKICKQEVLRRSLIKTSQGTAPERSKGRVAFVLKTQ